MHMVMTSDETQIQMFADWPMSNAKLVTMDNGQETRISCLVAIRRLQTDKNCPAENTWPNLVENEQRISRIGSKKTYGPQRNTQETTNENDAGV